MKGQSKETCLRKGTSIYFAANPTGCQVHKYYRRHPFSDIYKKALSISGQGQQPVSPELLLYFFCLLIQISLKCFHFTGSFPFLSWFWFVMHDFSISSFVLNLARGQGVRTEREVRTSWPRAKYFPVWPDLAQSISILSYDHLLLKILKILFKPK